MKELFIKKVSSTKNAGLDSAKHILEQETVSNSIGIINWDNYSYKPDVSFRTGHTDDQIWLKFEVKENYIRAKETRTNGDVYKDSCVEFFVSFDEKNYYNFEFNCIGTIHLAYGENRNNRNFVNPKIVNTIKIESTLGNQPFEEKKGNFEWDLIVKIPLTVFVYSDLKTLRKRKARANFYKCGDETAKPHFLTWNPVKTEQPDFHQPDYFGLIWFE